MNERTFKYVRHDQVERHVQCGWIRHPALDSTYHGEFSALMEWKGNDPYQAFIASKQREAVPIGIEVSLDKLTPALKPFQSALTRWALRCGRAALFESTGLGKTLQQLSFARVVADYKQGQILVLTPLAVAEQTVAEAERFGIGGVHYAADRKAIAGDIVVSNYERFEKFDITDFVGIVLDESGILKSDDGKTRALLTAACHDLHFKLCCSATPAPNDYSELGQHAEFLGVMQAKEMLATYFVHDGSIRANPDSESSGDGWRLKRHATNDFWRWVSSWAAVVQHPRDLGFEASEYDLPPLNLHQVTVTAEAKPTAGQLFPFAASTLSERIAVRRDTISARLATAVEIIARECDEPWLVWCNLNAEADALEATLDDALQVAGRHPPELKVERLLGFKHRHPRILVSKPSIAGHGMNYQHCARVLFIGLTDSFEQIYQAVRRSWRFGQARTVECYFIASELEGNVVANLKRKEAAFISMQRAMLQHMAKLTREAVRNDAASKQSYQPSQPMELPIWMRR